MSRFILPFVDAVDSPAVNFREIGGVIQNKSDGRRRKRGKADPERNRNKEVKEEQLQQRLEKLKALERELKEKEKAVKAKEKSLKEKDKAKKQMVLRLSPTLWNEIAAWAEEDFRSINGQVEYLLSECVRKRKGG